MGEARDMREPPYSVEWTSPAFKYVDQLAKHDYSYSVEECLGGPKPPSSKPEGKAYKRSYTVGSRPVANMTPDQREEARRANRRNRVLQREAQWQSKLEEEDS